MHPFGVCFGLNEVWRIVFASRGVDWYVLNLRSASFQYCDAMENWPGAFSIAEL